MGLTAEIHQALAPYKVNGAQHGTSGNSSPRLREIADKTNTTKANVATALQMISWGLEVNDDGNAIQDENGNFVKIKNEGVTEEMWQEMIDYATERGWQGGAYKSLNLAFENRLMGQPTAIRERMCKRVEDFTYNLLANVFNAGDTADFAIEAINKAGSYDPGPTAERLEDPADWTEEKIITKGAELDTDKGPEGDFDD